MTGSITIYYALVTLLMGAAGVGLYRMFAIERWARQAQEERRHQARNAETARCILRLEHELGILGHECGSECPRRQTSDEEEWKVLLRLSSAPPDEPTALYRLFPQNAQTGEAPLYIGLSAYESMRRQDYWPWPETRVEVEWFPSRKEANAARLRAILDERPRWTA